MATTYEVITGQNSGQEQSADSHSAPVPVVSTESPGNAAPSQSAQATSPSADGGGRSMSYEDLYKALNPYKPPTPEEVEKEKKKQKRDQIFAAIGDGIQALSNLFFTTQYAPNMYDGKNTASERVRVRYDKLLKERQNNAYAYINGLIGAKKADDAKADGERRWQRQLALDQQERERYDERKKHQQEREKIADDRYDDETKYRRGRDKAADDRWREQMDENRRNNDRNYNFRVKQQQDNKDIQERRIRATGARAVRGNQLAFSDGDGNEVSIYENVWRGSMQQVYDAMMSDFTPEDEKERARFERQMKRLDTPQKKEDYVKQNWHRSARAKAVMLALSKLDPATMTSEVTTDDDDVIDYNPADDDDVIDYVLGKK